MREIVRKRMKRGEIPGGWDVVLIARHSAHGASYAQLDEAIGSLLQRAGMIGENR
jgi:RNase P protein component